MPTYTNNRKVFHNYSIEDSIEAGMVLSGHEVKSIRSGNVSLEGAYVTVRAGEVFLRNAHVGKYKQAGKLLEVDETRERKLLLNRQEIIRLMDRTKEKGLTLVPLEIYTSKSRLKLKIGIAKGKKKYDKRESIKKKETRRSIDRVIKTRV